LIQKVKVIFHRWISKTLPTSTKPTYEKSARKKNDKKTISVGCKQRHKGNRNMETETCFLETRFLETRFRFQKWKPVSMTSFNLRRGTIRHHNICVYLVFRHQRNHKLFHWCTPPPAPSYLNNCATLIDVRSEEF
jgi:hypothetical protein